MRLELTILYRGTLSSCNYVCSYCPFAKHGESPEELAEDRNGLERFVNWVQERQNDRIAVFFTPWGEALVRHWYRNAIVRLSHLPYVSKVAVQTNLSCCLDWIADADTSKLGFWCTFHPGQTTLKWFLRQCERLSQLGVAHSVGCVGLREHKSAIELLRRSLPHSTYLWINADKSDTSQYDDELINSFEAIDPLFPLNNRHYVTRGRPCRTGYQVVTIDSLGDVRRCNFVKDVIGNIYGEGLESVLMKRPCPNETCGCHIGYVHLEHLQLDRLFGDGILERIPRTLLEGLRRHESSSVRPRDLDAL